MMALAPFRAIENLRGLREQFATRVPNPGRAIAQHRLTPGFGETLAAALYARGKQLGASIQSSGAFCGSFYMLGTNIHSGQLVQ
jgi:hypothetical protein